MIKDDIIQKIRQQNSLRRSSQAIAFIFQCWVSFAILAKLVFTSSLQDSDYSRLNQLLNNFIDNVLKVFPSDFMNLPNLHALKHLPEHARQYGSLVNISVSLKEMVHRLFKIQVPHTNKKNVELDFIKRENTLQSIRYIFDNRVDDRYQNLQFSRILHDDKLEFLFDSWYISPLSNNQNEDIEDDQAIIHSPLDNYINIIVRGKWDLKAIKKSGFSGNNLDKTIMSDLSWAYYNYFDQDTLIINYKVTFYQQVSFEIFDVDTFLKIEVKVRVGDIVDMSGVSDDQEDDQWFARIAAIITHKNNYTTNNCIFLIFDWFERYNFDTNLQCQRYKLQEGTEDWKRIHSITVITTQPKWHFVHDCKNNCVTNNHDLINNRVFYKNDYLYTAV
ncbi:hypothetical protein RhiirA4_478668 [Rhizophagus irregularis]|uniref:Uncharacterized protein n=2 Tax=Rhizophagus irregularis TaxID=588596 RepID=A0A2I1HF63_9GLOM|nr:hypothetical protein RhiirA4_478668 [Rhizophagus irregularis]